MKVSSLLVLLLIPSVSSLTLPTLSSLPSISLSSFSSLTSHPIFQYLPSIPSLTILTITERIVKTKIDYTLTSAQARIDLYYRFAMSFVILGWAWLFLSAFWLIVWIWETRCKNARMEEKKRNREARRRSKLIVGGEFVRRREEVEGREEELSERAPDPKEERMEQWVDSVNREAVDSLEDR